MYLGCPFSSRCPLPRLARVLLNLVAILAGLSYLAGGLSVCAAVSVSLADLDLSQMQTEAGPLVRGEQFRTNNGLALRPGASLWVDLKNDAQELRATVEPLPGSRGSPVLCRFSTANDIRYVVVGANTPATEITLPLAGQELLVVEALATEESEGIKILVTSSSIVSKTTRPEAIGGAAPVRWDTGEWKVEVDGRSGGISHLAHAKDKIGMEWVRQAAPWGTGWARIEGVTTAWDRPVTMRRISGNGMEAVYEIPRLRVRVRRTIDADARLNESYTFENTGTVPLMMSEDALGIRLPLVDNYPGAEVCLPQRCHAHLWMGGSSAYVNAMRMGGASPHLGLVVTEGGLTHYSIHDRIQHSNDRGQFVVHPPAFTLPPGKTYTVSWKLFWHTGWDDFFRQAATHENFVRLEAERYTVAQGEPLRISVTSGHALQGAHLFVNGKLIETQAKGKGLHAEIPTSQLGEYTVELEDAGRRSFLRAFVTPAPLALVAARVKFIVEQQQKRAPGERLNGAYLIYDNETNTQVYDGSFSDHNAARERLGMGVLAALYLKRCDDAALIESIEKSLEAYAAFVAREVQNEAGTVFNDAGRARQERMYNYPWAIQFHLAMYEALGKPEYLRRALDACRMYYAKGGEKFYCIGMPVLQMLQDLEAAGWTNEEKEMLAAFRKHATVLLRIGAAYPKHEVNYEQSIVGPAAQLMLEVYLATGDPAFLQGAKEQMRLLELFGGRQPDHRLNDIAIRHWDDYWFGKRRVYADTFPHYWSTITGVVFSLYARATGDESYQKRAEAILANNLCSFRPDGRASCAYVYPLTVNGAPGDFFDPWANDQDWALVNWLQVNAPVGK